MYHKHVQYLIVMSIGTRKEEIDHLEEDLIWIVVMQSKQNKNKLNTRFGNLCDLYKTKSVKVKMYLFFELYY